MPFEPIAIVGCACILPGALSPEALWEAVVAGRDLLTVVPEGRWGIAPSRILVADPEHSADRTWSQRGGYVEGFDAIFDLRRRSSAHLQSESDVLAHGHRRKQRVILRQKADVAQLRRQTRHVLAAQVEVRGRLHVGAHVGVGAHDVELVGVVAQPPALDDERPPRRARWHDRVRQVHEAVRSEVDGKHHSLSLVRPHDDDVGRVGLHREPHGVGLHAHGVLRHVPHADSAVEVHAQVAMLGQQVTAAYPLDGDRGGAFGLAGILNDHRGDDVVVLRLRGGRARAETLGALCEVGESIMIVCLAVVVGFIVVSIVLPILKDECDDAVEEILRFVEAARKEGAMALFGEKYGDEVRVVIVGGRDPEHTSRELCGGTHVRFTGEIGAFRILSEESVAAGVRRIEAATGAELEALLDRKLQILHAACERLKSTEEALVLNIEKLQTLVKEQRKEIRKYRSSGAEARLQEILERGKGFPGLGTLFQGRVDGLPVEELRGMVDRIRKKASTPVGLILLSVDGDRVHIVSAFDEPFRERGADAGRVCRDLGRALGGGGGGRPNMAQGQGKKTGEADRALAEIVAALEKTFATGGK